jgi:putative transposase
MKKIFFENAEELAVLIKREISYHYEGRYNHRLHVILLMTLGHSAKEVSQLFGDPLRTVQHWALHFKKQQLEGLKEEPRRGRPRKLSESQMQQLAQHLRMPTSTFGYQQGFWDGPLLKHHIKRQFRVELSLRSCQIIFHRLGMTLKSPRPQMAGASPEAREEFKKN